MKKFGVYSVFAVYAFCFLLWLSPLKAHATSTVTMKFDGTTYNGKGGNSSGGVATYPYYFTINGSSTEIPLLCVSYQDKVKVGESWTADVYVIGAGTLAETGLTTTQQEEEAYLDSVILNPSSSSSLVTDAQWAAWEVSDSGLIGHLPNGLNNSAINTELTNAESFVATNTLTSDAKFYDAYQLYVPASGWPSKDGTPQTYIGPVPEPSSLILFGSGLLTAAGALYRRKRRTA